MISTISTMQRMNRMGPTAELSRTPNMITVIREFKITFFQPGLHFDGYPRFDALSHRQGENMYTRKSSGDEIPERNIGSYTPLTFNTPTEVSPGTISIKFCYEAQNGEKILPKVLTP